MSISSFQIDVESVGADSDGVCDNNAPDLGQVKFQLRQEHNCQVGLVLIAAKRQQNTLVDGKSARLRSVFHSSFTISLPQ